MALGSVNLELEAVVSHPMLALGTEFRTSGGTDKLLTAELLIQCLEFICKDDILRLPDTLDLSANQTVPHTS